MTSGMERDGHMTPADPHKVGTLVLKARLAANLSQGGLAEAVTAKGVHLSQAKVSAIEGGKQLPSRQVADCLAQLLPGLDLSGLDLPTARATGDTAPPPKATKVETKAPTVTLDGVPSPATVKRESVIERHRGAVKAEKVADFPRVTLYLDPGTKALLDAAVSVTGTPAYQLLTEAFRGHLAQLPKADRDLIETLAARRSK
jgi:hypothetical protein